MAEQENQPTAGYTTKALSFDELKKLVLTERGKRGFVGLGDTTVRELKAIERRRSLPWWRRY